LKKNTKLKKCDVDDPLLYCGVAQSNIIKDLSEDVKAYFSEPYKLQEKAPFQELF
jgi:hypothetical protein